MKGTTRGAADGITGRGTVTTVVLRDGRIAEGVASERVPPPLEATELGRTARVERAARTRASQPDRETVGIGPAQVAPHKGPVGVPPMAPTFVAPSGSQSGRSLGPLQGGRPTAPLRCNVIPPGGTRTADTALPSVTDPRQDVPAKGGRAVHSRA
jgi:hypothetical protein